MSEVIRAALRLLEKEENIVLALKKAIREGIESGVAEDFEPNQFFLSLKAKRNNG